MADTVTTTKKGAIVSINHKGTSKLALVKNTDSTGTIADLLVFPNDGSQQLMHVDKVPQAAAEKDNLSWDQL